MVPGPLLIKLSLIFQIKKKEFFFIGYEIWDTDEYDEKIKQKFSVFTNLNN